MSVAMNSSDRGSNIPTAKLTHLQHRSNSSISNRKYASIRKRDFGSNDPKKRIKRGMKGRKRHVHTLHTYLYRVCCKGNYILLSKRLFQDVKIADGNLFDVHTDGGTVGCTSASS